MTRPIPPLFLALILLFPVSARADFTITDFSTTTVNLVYPAVPAGGGPANVASVVGSALQVTPGVLSALGAVWADTPEVLTGGFSTEFTFEFLPSPTGGGGGSGDGLAFVIQNDPIGLDAIGNHASAMGYGGFSGNPGRGINASLAIEIDDYLGAGQNDPNANHVSIHTRYTGDNSADHALASLAETTNVPFFGQGSGIHTVGVEYDGQTLSVYFDDPNTPILTLTINLASVLGGSSGYIGFTGSGGGAYQVENVYTWSFATGVNGAEDCGNGTDDDGDGDIDCADSDCSGDPIACPAGEAFYRGDTNNDGGVNIADAVYLLSVLFPTGPANALTCLDAGDANADGGLNIADAITLLNSLFASPAPPLPFPNAGDGCSVDPGSTLGCDSFDACP